MDVCMRLFYLAASADVRVCVKTIFIYTYRSTRMVAACVVLVSGGDLATATPTAAATGLLLLFADDSISSGPTVAVVATHTHTRPVTRHAR